MTASLIPTPVMQFFDSNGDSLSGGKVYTYAAGTSTPLATYTDQGGATPNANPVILDSRGEAAIWFGGSSYKIILKTSVDVLIWTADNVTGLASLAASTGSSLIGFIQAGTGAVATTAQAKMRESVSVFDFMTAAQVADVVGNIGSLDVTAAGTAAIATGKSVYWPQGTYKVSPIGPAVTGSLVGPPPAAEPNRTSLWVLGDNQSMFGDGPGSILTWGTPGTKQFFFKVADANNVEVRNLSFSGGYGAVVIDPTSDGSVDTVTVSDCYFSSMLADLELGRQWAIYQDSKYSKNITVKGCHSRDCANHSITFTNTYNAKAIGNDFVNVTAGFCIDASQGTHGVVIANNTGKNVLYFAKAESSQPAAGATAAQAASNRVVVSGNQVEDITTIGFFLNSAADNVSITGNVFKGMTTGIKLDTVTGFTHSGNVTVSGNTLYGDASGSSIGIQDIETNGTLTHTFSDNAIDNFNVGYSIVRPKASVSGGSINASGAGIVLDTAGLLNGISINDVTIVSAGNGVSITNATAYKRVKVTNCRITYGSGGGIYGPSAAASLCDISGNTCDGAVGVLTGIYLKTPQSCSIQNNLINTPVATALNAIVTATSTTDCIICGNISVKALDIQGPAGTTVSTGNIIAAYVA